MRIPEFLARQGRCPTGLLGGLVARVMARETSAENALAVELLEVQPADHVLEIGFGHGRTLGRATALVSSGIVTGVDPSERMLRMAARFNREHIAAGRVELKLGDSSRLPFSDRCFDKVYSVHTLYFWTCPADDVREIARVMKPVGRLVLGYRTRDDEATRGKFPTSTHNFYIDAEVKEFLASGGFAGIQFTQRRFSPTRIVHFAVAHRT